VREIVETTLSLCRCFAVLAVQTFIGWTAVMAHFVLRSMSITSIYKDLTAFIFELSLGLSSATIPLVLYLNNVKVNAAFKKQFRAVFRQRIKSIGDGRLVGLDGHQLNVTVEEEGTIYFKQLKHAWQ
ncbi:hypothetical protein GCK32_005137, partial [Trichostrongylus colubriformis]